MMRTFIFFFFVLISGLLRANRVSFVPEIINENGIDQFQSFEECDFMAHSDQLRPNRLLLKWHSRLKISKKIVSAALAFPLPFGLVGMHRIFLGTKPYVPVVYIATVGGCFGILPFIDFFVIIFEKNPDQFNDNSRVFMWVK